jgi:hypothetical protein
MAKRTYFGLEIIQGKLIRRSDVAALPFADFWAASSVGSAFLTDDKTGEEFTYLHDWEAFARLFIQTGRHRFMPAVDDT